MGNRDRKFQIRMTQTEFEWLEKQAAAANMSKTRYLTYLVEREEKGAKVALRDGETPPILVYNDADLRKLDWQLCKWGNNLNQAARDYNELAGRKYVSTDNAQRVLDSIHKKVHLSMVAIVRIEENIQKLHKRRHIVIDKR